METKSIDAKERTARVYPSKQTTRKFYNPFPNHLWFADLIDIRLRDLVTIQQFNSSSFGSNSLNSSI